MHTLSNLVVEFIIYNNNGQFINCNNNAMFDKCTFEYGGNSNIQNDIQFYYEGNR